MTKEWEGHAEANYQLYIRKDCPVKTRKASNEGARMPLSSDILDAISTIVKLQTLCLKDSQDAFRDFRNEELDLLMRIWDRLDIAMLALFNALESARDSERIVT